MSYTMNDLFAGGAGTICGAEQVPGLTTRWAANHYSPAIETINRNFPHVETCLQDLMQADWRDVPRCDILGASPECLGHGKARGKERPHHDNSRSTAWAPIQALDVYRQRKCLPRAVVIENVPEFLDWLLFPEWLGCMFRFGYTTAPARNQVYDAQRFGARISRERLIMVFTRSRAPMQIKSPDMKAPPALDLIQWESGPWAAVRSDGSNPHRPNTLRQIADGQCRGWDRFLIRYNGSQRKAGVAEDPLKPLGSLTTHDRFAVVRTYTGRPEIRMLTLSEMKSGMGFPDSYWLPGRRDVGVKLIGNAVSPPLAKGILEQVIQAL